MESHEELKKVEFELSDGRKCVVREGNGDDNFEASKMMNGNNTHLFLGAMIARVTTIDGNPVVIEDLKAMKLKDMMLIQTKFSEINF